MIDMRVKSDKINLNKFSRKFKTMGKDIFDDVFSEMLRTGNIVIRDVQKSMLRTKRGTTANSSGHRPSLPGHPPAVDSGRLFKSLVTQGKKSDTNAEVEFGSKTGAPYAEFLENGTRKMRARPFLAPGWLRNRDAFENRLQKIINTKIRQASR